MSFIIIPARKGFQAASVTVAGPPKKEAVSANETTAVATDGAWGAWGAEVLEGEKAAADEPTVDVADGAWGAWGAEAPEEEKAAADEATVDAADGAWGAGGAEAPEKETKVNQGNEITAGSAHSETAMEEVHLPDNNDSNAEATEGEWGSGGW